jgi:hypothetical protein
MEKVKLKVKLKMKVKPTNLVALSEEVHENWNNNLSSNGELDSTLV